jgi:hypothetical protein
VSDGGINQDPVDRYTSAHAGVGATMAWFGMPGWMALLVSVGWELVENDLKDRFPGSFPYSSKDSAANAVSDTLAVLAGWRLAKASKDSPTERERLALAAAVGSTLGALTMPVAIGAAKVKGRDPKRPAARTAYVWGTAVGAAIGSALELHRTGVRDWSAYALQMSLCALGGGLGGPVGAAASGYIGGAELERSGVVY